MTAVGWAIDFEPGQGSAIGSSGLPGNLGNLRGEIVCFDRDRRVCLLTFIFLLEMARGFDADGVRVTPAAVGLDRGADAGADLVVDDGMLFDHGDDRVVDERPEMRLGGGSKWGGF